MYRKLIPFLAIVGAVLFFASVSLADVPAPPVEQSLGKDDVLAGDLVEADCRICHDTGVPDRHHMLYGTAVGGSTPPYPNPGGDTNWTCVSCHSDAFVLERDCTVCHTASPHHGAGSTADSGDCQSCHNLVDNIGDGHNIPSYSPTLVTPRPSSGTADELNAYGNSAGACDYCHDGDDAVTPVLIQSNQTLHHATGFGSDATKCAWCHDLAAPAEEKIRRCEGCHGPDSLHNIQADSPASPPGTVVVGGEDAGYGHVGRDQGPTDSDCWGCHGFGVPKSDGVPNISAIIPTLYNSDRSVVDAGVATVVNLRGAALTNITDGKQYKSIVVMTGADGSAVKLAPGLITQGVVSVTIPASTAAGNYDLRAVKTNADGDPVPSNPVAISVKPNVAITGVTVNGTTLTITGSGFSGYAPGSGTIVAGEGQAAATILAWTDTAIVARFDAAPGQVTVSSVFGSASAEVAGAGPDAWVVNAPTLGPDFQVTFEQLGGVLVVRTSSGSVLLGMEFGSVIFWMDMSGTIYFGNIDRGAGTASGIAFGSNAIPTAWSAKPAE